MNNNTRRTTGIARPTTALGAAVLVMGSLALGACSKSDPNAAAPAAAGQSQQQSAGAASSAGDTIDLVDAAVQTPAAQNATGSDSNADGKADRKGLRARLLRALHATWVTESKSGPVTHQAVRGEVTAVSATSVTVKARDGFSLTFAVTADTKVRVRSNGKGADSTIGVVKVGDKALVMGVGATNPTARAVVFRDGTTPRPSSTPSPSATS